MITVRADSVSGQPCFVFLRAGKPIYTWWGEPGQSLFYGVNHLDIGDTSLEELKKLLETMTALGMKYPELVEAVNTFLKENAI